MSSTNSTAVPQLELEAEPEDHLAYRPVRTRWPASPQTCGRPTNKHDVSGSGLLARHSAQPLRSAARISGWLMLATGRRVSRAIRARRGRKRMLVSGRHVLVELVSRQRRAKQLDEHAGTGKTTRAAGTDRLAAGSDAQPTARTDEEQRSARSGPSRLSANQRFVLSVAHRNRRAVQASRHTRLGSSSESSPSNSDSGIRSLPRHNGRQPRSGSGPVTRTSQRHPACCTALHDTASSKRS